MSEREREKDVSLSFSVVVENESMSGKQDNSETFIPCFFFRYSVPDENDEDALTPNKKNDAIARERE